MKLILCQDVFKLDYQERRCKCGRCKGRYLANGLNAEYTEGIPLGFNNTSLAIAIRNQPQQGRVPSICDSKILYYYGED